MDTFRANGNAVFTPPETGSIKPLAGTLVLPPCLSRLGFVRAAVKYDPSTGIAHERLHGSSSWVLARPETSLVIWLTVFKFLRCLASRVWHNLIHDHDPGHCSLTLRTCSGCFLSHD